MHKQIMKLTATNKKLMVKLGILMKDGSNNSHYVPSVLGDSDLELE